MMCLISPCVLFADTGANRKNPFLFADEEALLERKKTPAPVVTPVAARKPKKTIIQKTYWEAHNVHVSAILFSPPKSKAIIDGNIVGEGDTIAGKRVLTIEAESVILEEGGYKYIARLSKVAQ